MHSRLANITLACCSLRQEGTRNRLCGTSSRTCGQVVDKVYSLTQHHSKYVVGPPGRPGRQKPLPLWNIESREKRRVYTSNDTAHSSRHNRYRMSCWEGSSSDGAFELVHKKKEKVRNGYFWQRHQHGPMQKHKQAEKGRTPGLAPFRDYSSLSSEI